jgi:hypothetical protein
LTATSRKPLSQCFILVFWLPLAASAAMLTIEGPVVQAAITRLPDPETNLAAFGIVLSLSSTIGAPGIMLLATSTALCHDQGAYHVVRRFMIWLNLLLVAIAAIVAFTPLYNQIVAGALGVPMPIAEAARPGMRIAVLWTGVIGWRRFYQGILIRTGETRRVSSATVVRLVVAGVIAALLVVWGKLSGVSAGTVALAAGILAEAALVTWLVRPSLVRHLSPNASATQSGSPPRNPSPAITSRRVVAYHAPLAATSVMALLAQPLISAGLARMLFPEHSLAAWPVVFGLVAVMGTFGLATQEVVIALTKDAATLDSVRRFSFSVAVGSVLVLILIAFTPVADFVLHEIMGMSTELASFAVPGLRAALLLPGLTALRSWQRGLLMKGDATSSVYRAMGLNLVITAVALGLGVIFDAPGVQMAAIAMTVALVAELVFLAWRTRDVMAPLTSDV